MKQVRQKANEIGTETHLGTMITNTTMITYITITIWNLRTRNLNQKEDSLFQEVRFAFSVANFSFRQSFFFLHLGGSGGGINPLALLVAPLAAISLLAAAAAVAINPVLVQVSFTGKRRKRSVTDDENNDNDQEWNPEVQEKMHELQVSFTNVKKKKNSFTFACTHKHFFL